MDIVVGEGALARGLVDALVKSGPVVYASLQPATGPFFWRRANMSSGEGIVSTVRDAKRVFIVVEPGADASGLFAVLRPGSIRRGVVALPLGSGEPSGLDRHRHLSVVRVGPVWGPHEPLIDRWASDVASGRSVWVSDPGEVWPVPVGLAVEGIVAAVERPSLRWTLAGEKGVRLPELHQFIAKTLDRPSRSVRVPLALAARRAGIDPGRILAWCGRPGASSSTPGWKPTENPLSRKAWIGSSSRWLAVERSG